MGMGGRRELTFTEHLLGAKKHIINIHVSYGVSDSPAGGDITALILQITKWRL